MKRTQYQVTGIAGVAAATMLLLLGAVPASATAGSEKAQEPSPEVLPATPQQAAPGPSAGVSDAERSGHGNAEVAVPPLSQGLSVEQVRNALTEAEKRRRETLKPDPAVSNEVLVDKWGVEVQGISRTAGGYMLDFRFRVVDVSKALPLFDHRVKPYVRAEKSGINLPVPVGAKVGALRPTNRGQNIKSDKTYYMIFANPDSHLKTGDKVSVVIGDFKVENLTVN